MQRSYSILLLSLFMALSEQADPNLTICGSVLNGFVNDPTSCEGYYTCVDGIGYSQKCLDGLHFVPSKLACDYPNADGTCEGVLSCPADVDFTRLPIAGSCTGYLLCFLGVGSQEECATGLQFNAATGECDLIANVKCIDVSGCPAVDTPGDPVFIPHPSECRKYYYCIGGQASAEVLECPVGYIFQASSQTCIRGTCPLV